MASAYDRAYLETIVSLIGNVDILAKGNEIDGSVTPSKIRAEFLRLIRRAVD